MKFHERHLLNQRSSQKKLMQLTGYWADDIWDIHSCPLLKSPWRYTHRYVRFDSLANVQVRQEVKNLFSQKLLADDWRLSTVWIGYGRHLKNLGQFLDREYPYIRSSSELPVEEGLMRWRTFRAQLGLRSDQRADSLWQHLCQIGHEDLRDEYQKDCWDVRRLGIEFNRSKTNYQLRFCDIPQDKFRILVKRFAKIQLSRNSFSYVQAIVGKLTYFFRYIHESYPNWHDLKSLSRVDIENFLSWLWTTPMGGVLGHKKKPSTAYHVVQTLKILRRFIEYIQLADWSEAPVVPVRRLILPEDFPRKPRHSPDQVRYIPETVLNQLHNHIDKLPKDLIALVIVLEATGFRISDVCSLKLDCLKKDSGGFWIVGGQRKVKIERHKVPVSAEVAAVVQTQIEHMKTLSTPENNPEKFLFTRLRGNRRGWPMRQKNVSEALNRLARRCSIIDDTGQIFHFNNHAFRHSKGVELINNGMNLVHVQQWLAHVSPEMTLTYARILDTTMREAWEKTLTNGVLKINDDGAPLRINMQTMAEENGIQWEWVRHNLDAVRLPNGYCFVNKKMGCPVQDKCLNCSSFCTTPEFLPVFQSQIDDTRELIVRGRKQGLEHWVAKNEKILNHLEQIATTLQAGVIHHTAGKHCREYTFEERRETNEF